MDPPTPDPDLGLQCPAPTKDRDHLTQKILRLTLEIMYLLTGEKCTVVTMASVESLLRGMFSPMPGGWSWNPTEPPAHASVPEMNNEMKILEVTNQITELLTGEVPVGCQDVTVSLSMAEWQYLKGHKELYKTGMMEDQPPLTSQADEDGIGKASEDHLFLNPDHTEVDVTQLNDRFNPTKPLHVKSEMLNPACCLEGRGVDRRVPFPSNDSSPVESDISTTEAHLGAHNLSRPAPPNSEEYVKAEGSACHRELYSMDGPFIPDSEECTFGISEIPATDIRSGRCSEAPLDEPSNPECIAIKPEVDSQCRPQADDSSDAEGCGYMKPESPTSDDDFEGAHSVPRSLKPFDLNKFRSPKSEIPISDIHTDFQRSVPTDDQPESHSGGRSPSSYHPKESPQYNLITVHIDSETGSPSYEDEEQFLEKTAAMPYIQSGLHGEDRSPNSSSPEYYANDHSTNFHSGPRRMDFSSDSEELPSSESHIKNKHCGLGHMVRSPEFDCLEESTPDKLAFFISNLKPGLANFFPDAPRSSEPSLKRPPRTLRPYSKKQCRSVEPNPNNPSRTGEPSSKTLSTYVEVSENSQSLDPYSKNPSRSLEAAKKPPRLAEPASKNSLRSGEMPPKRIKTIKQRIVYPTDNIYPCSECKQQFVLKSDLIVHQKVHAGISGFTCPVCSKPFKGRAELSRHVRSHTGEKPFACSICGKCFTRRPNLYVHERIHRGEKPFTCPKCSRRFTHKQSYERHLMLHTNGVTFDCLDCGKDCKNKAGFLAHQRLHMRELDCDPPLISQTLLQQQELVQLDINSFSCSKCAMSFTSQLSLNNHEAIHESEVSFSCLKCGMIFSSQSSLESHETIHNAADSFFCSECAMSFPNAAALKHHEAIHNAEKSLPCSKSGMAFPNEIILEDHNSGEAFSCLVCGMMFPNRALLEAHETIHKAEGPFSCLECGMCFQNESSLEEHEAIHKSEGYFSCLKCGLYFPNESSLQHHDAIHKSEDSFPCSKCGLTFPNESLLEHHEAAHHPEGSFSALVHDRLSLGKEPFRKPYTCSECGKTFSAKSRLLLHQRVHRSGKMCSAPPT